ncbi:hypothetical protein BURKHO8Y_210299 [Burkholderia sp. 8Y]|nr:hypothetical protein BURKHO8Y_210299 [Burkholderia sp. 8Y]
MVAVVRFHQTTRVASAYSRDIEIICQHIVIFRLAAWRLLGAAYSASHVCLLFPLSTFFREQRG